MPHPGVEAVHDLSLAALADGLRQRRLSSVEVTRALLKRIAAADAGCGCFITVLAERALDQAARADREIGAGRWRGALHGVPVAVKDLCETSFAPTTAGMPLRRNYLAARTATVVERLEAAGAILIGKLAMTEGAFSQHRPELPRPKNPWNAAYWPGSSSSGSGVATATGFCFGALGTDTGGSIRYPAACNGVTGVKPTWGRVSLRGIVPLAASMDHVGPMARSAADCAVLLGVVAGEDREDTGSLGAPVPDYYASIGAGIGNVRIGFDPRYTETGTEPDVLTALAETRAVLEASGARIVEVAFPPTDALTAAWLPLCAVEAAAVHRACFHAHAADYGSALAALIRLGAGLGAADRESLQQLRQTFCVEVNSVFADIDLLLTPVLSRTVPTLLALDDPAADRSWLRRFTTPFNLTGQPTVTFPAGIDAAGLPIGMQLVGRPLGEELLLRAAHAFQERTAWHRRRPQLAQEGLRR